MPDSTINEALNWLKQAEDKTPIIPNRKTQDRHNSEWKPTVIHKDDKDGLKKLLQERKKFSERYPTNQSKE